MRLRKSRQPRRRGAIIVLAALMMVLMFGMVAFAVDLGFIALVRTQLQRTADSAAHAAAMNLTDLKQAKAVAIQTAAMQDVAGIKQSLTDTDVEFGMRSWNGTGYSYAWGTAAANCVRVTAHRTANNANGPVNLFFAPVLGMGQADVTAQSIAAVNPRDLVFVIDLSGSMNHDTEPWSTGALNHVSAGAGDQVMQDLWDDLGLTGQSVPVPLPDTPQYRFDFNSRNNIEIELPQLNGMTVAQSQALYASTSGAGTSNVTVQNGKIKAKLKYSDINNIFKSSSLASKLPASHAQYAHSQGGASHIKNYDFVIDQYLPTVMKHAKPPVSNPQYRDYWRGYMSYSRGFTSGTGSSNGIKGWANPSNSFYGDQYSSLYLDASGNPYSSSAMQADFNKMVDKASYSSYIQFMMDHGFNSKPGLDANGNSSACCYTPMSMRWEGDGGSAADAYRQTDADGNVRPPREQPISGVVDAMIAALKEVKRQNANVPPSLRDHVAVLTFHSDFTAITGSQTNPFTDDYDQVIKDVIKNCSQAQPNGKSNVDGTSGSTNSQYGLEWAYNWLNKHGRPHTNKAAVLFSDGVANASTNNYPLDDYSTSKIDLDGDGKKTDTYYYSSDNTDPRNAALKSASRLHAKNAVVHTVTAGAGRDPEFMRRMSLLSNGFSRDSGTTIHEYATNLVKDFQDLANQRAITFALGN